jgi:hypothetical protein
MSIKSLLIKRENNLPGHLIGTLGKVKIAFPPLKFLIAGNTFFTYSGE